MAEKNTKNIGLDRPCHFIRKPENPTIRGLSKMFMDLVKNMIRCAVSTIIFGMGVAIPNIKDRSSIAGPARPSWAFGDKWADDLVMGTTKKYF